MKQKAIKVSAEVAAMKAFRKTGAFGGKEAAIKAYEKAEKASAEAAEKKAKKRVKNSKPLPPKKQSKASEEIIEELNYVQMSLNIGLKYIIIRSLQSGSRGTEECQANQCLNICNPRQLRVVNLSNL